MFSLCQSRYSIGSLISFPEGNKKEIEGKKMPGKINFLKQPVQLVVDFPIHWCSSFKVYAVNTLHRWYAAKGEEEQKAGCDSV